MAVRYVKDHYLFRGSVPTAQAGLSRVIAGLAALGKGVYLAVSVLPGLTAATIRLPFVSFWSPHSSEVLAGLLGVWIVAACGFLSGWRTRLAGAVLVTSMTAVMLADRQLYSNHLYLLILVCLLLSIADSGRAVSVHSRPGGGPHRIAAWPIILLRLQLTIVYGFSVLSKLNVAFLAGTVVYFNWWYGGLLPMPDWLRTREALGLLATTALLCEVFLAFGFWSRRLVPACLLVGFLLHATIILTMGDPWELTIFGLTMASMYVLFVPETWLGRLFAGHGGLRLPEMGGTASSPIMSSIR